MSRYSFLDENIRLRLNLIAKEALHEVSITEPPVDYSRLYKNQKLHATSYERFDPALQDLAREFQIKKLEDIRGVLFVPDKQVIIISDDYKKRNNFTFAHEFGHWEIPSHRALLYKCTQFDLRPIARKQMEREANYFASELSFMGEIFTEYLFSSPVSMKSIMDLSDKFGMSIEATLIRAVELEIRPCALLSLVVHNDNPEKFLTIRYALYSEKFKTEIGEINYSQAFNSDHELAKIVTETIPRLINSHEFTSNFGKGKDGQVKHKLKTEVWKNDWNIFALFQPENK